ncbi:MAG TPA: hypothetical protein PLO84_14325 [Thermotogota bacterium]|nr:hypothetical protein [Thermotogota bacterium]HPJ90290.1 hypothetical protein [Thermotogota bacterium]
MNNYTLYLNGNNINTLRIIGALKSLEENVGIPEKIVATGISSMIAVMYAKLGLNETTEFFKMNFKLIENLFSFDFFETNRGIMARNESYRKISDFYTLVKSGSSIKNFNDLYAFLHSDQTSEYLGIEEFARIRKFILTFFPFMNGYTLPIPCYTSLFNVETAEENIISITSHRELMAAISIIPFMGPIEIDHQSFISMQNIQGVSSPVNNRETGIHIFLDTLSENGTPPFMSAMYILIAADYMGTLELKKRIEKEFTCDINLWENPEHLKTTSFGRLIDEGFQTTEKHFKRLFKRMHGPNDN